MTVIIKLLQESRAAQTIALSHSGGSSVVSFNEGEDELFFLGGVLAAVHTGRVVYFADAEYSAGQIRAINSFANANKVDTLVRVSSSNLDFIVGSCLTKAGLPLTRRERSNESNSE